MLARLWEALEMRLLPAAPEAAGWTVNPWVDLGEAGQAWLPLGSGSVLHVHAFFSLCPGEDSSDLIRHFLIESSAKGVHLKGADEEPYFGEPAGPGRRRAGGWSREGLLTLSPHREPVGLCVPAFHHGPGPALQTHHPAERWVWAPRRQHRGSHLTCSLDYFRVPVKVPARQPVNIPTS